jgi:hypothetical protein
VGPCSGTTAHHSSPRTNAVDLALWEVARVCCRVYHHQRDQL